jgi:hypothetical protein
MVRLGIEPRSTPSQEKALDTQRISERIDRRVQPLLPPKIQWRCSTIELPDRFGLEFEEGFVVEDDVVEVSGRGE